MSCDEFWVILDILWTDTNYNCLSNISTINNLFNIFFLIFILLFSSVFDHIS